MARGLSLLSATPGNGTVIKSEDLLGEFTVHAIFAEIMASLRPSTDLRLAFGRKRFVKHDGMYANEV